MPANKGLLDNVAIVLVRPKRAENVGAAARSAANMGINRLIIVGDRMLDVEVMARVATHHASYLIDDLCLAPSLDEALAQFNWVVGTSARQGRRRPLASPKKMMPELVSKLAGNEVALLFGSEDRGLTNEDLKFCNAVTTIPTADFSSLNLGQAVAILSYEVYTAALEADCGSLVKHAKLAESRELEVMYDFVEQALRKMGYLREDDYSHWMHNIRQFLSRVGLKGREARTIRGFCRQIISTAEKK